MKEGFLIGGGILLAGLLLQLVAGPVNWSFFAWPVNIIVLVLILSLIGLMYVLRGNIHAFEWMMHYGAAVPSLVYPLSLTIVMGLTVQVEKGGIPGISRMLEFWPFVLSWTWMMLIAGLTSLNRIIHFKVREIPFILNHLGVFIAIVTATLGNGDKKEVNMIVSEGETEWHATDAEGGIFDPGIAIELHDFIMDVYQDGSPKRFASDITVYTRDGKNIRGTVDVNKPLKVGGWKIYQYGYDVASGTGSTYSEFLMVKDPWITWIYLGIFMMLAGALCLMFFMAPKPVRADEGGNEL